MPVHTYPYWVMCTPNLETSSVCLDAASATLFCWQTDGWTDTPIPIGQLLCLWGKNMVRSSLVAEIFSSVGISTYNQAQLTNHQPLLSFLLDRSQATDWLGGVYHPISRLVIMEAAVYNIDMNINMSVMQIMDLSMENTQPYTCIEWIPAVWDHFCSS